MTEETKKGKKPSKEQIILIVLLVALLGILIAFILTFTTNNKNNQNGSGNTGTDPAGTGTTVVTGGSGNNGSDTTGSISENEIADEPITFLSGTTENLYSLLGIAAGTGISAGDESIATIDKDGNLKGLSYGDTEITWTETDENGASIKRTVPIHIGVEQIDVVLSERSVSLEPGEGFQLEATITDENGNDISNYVNIFWYSSDESTVAVDENGLVTAVAPGNGSVTVRVNCEEAEIGISVAVTVKEPETEPVPETHNHYFVVTSNTGASCTKSGNVVYTCSCGETVEEFVKAFGHDYQITEKVDATCAAKGHTTYTCNNCGDSYKKTKKALKHSYKVTESVSATCVKDGHSTYTCSNCGDSYQKTQKAYGHSYKVKENVPATCINGGHTTYSCGTCGDTYQNTLAATGVHTYVYSDPGYSRWHHKECTGCGISTDEECPCGDYETCPLCGRVKPGL